MCLHKWTNPGVLAQCGSCGVAQHSPGQLLPAAAPSAVQPAALTRLHFVLYHLPRGRSVCNRVSCLGKSQGFGIFFNTLVVVSEKARAASEAEVVGFAVSLTFWFARGLDSPKLFPRQRISVFSVRISVSEGKKNCETLSSRSFLPLGAQLGSCHSSPQ